MEGGGVGCLVHYIKNLNLELKTFPMILHKGLDLQNNMKKHC